MAAAAADVLGGMLAGCFFACSLFFSCVRAKVRREKREGRGEKGERVQGKEEGGGRSKNTAGSARRPSRVFFFFLREGAPIEKTNEKKRRERQILPLSRRTRRGTETDTKLRSYFRPCLALRAQRESGPKERKEEGGATRQCCSMRVGSSPASTLLPQPLSPGHWNAFSPRPSSYPAF